MGFTPSPNETSGDTLASGSLHQFTGSVSITGSLTVNGVNVSGGGGGSGDVTGPGSSTDNAIARYDLTTGKIIQNSGITIDDSNNITGIVDLASTGNTTLGNTSTDYHQVSGTLSISGSQPLVVYGPEPSYTGGPSIIARYTSSVGGANMWQQPASGALIVSADTWGLQPNGSVMYVHSNGAAATIAFKNSSTIEASPAALAGLQSNKVTSDKGAFVGLQNTDLHLRNQIGNVILTADGSQELIIDGAGTTIGNAVSDYHQVTGTLGILGSVSASLAVSASSFWGDGKEITNLTLPSGSINRTDSTGMVTYYTTISGAIAASTAGDFVRVGPGTYIEDSPINIPSGISVIGEAGWQVTDVSSSTGTGDLFILSDASLLRDFKIAVPSDTGSYGAKFSGSNGEVATINFLQFYGGTALRGCGYGNQGEGKSLGLEIRYGAGDCDAIMQVEDGILAVEGMHVPGTAGSVDAGVRASSPSATRIGRRGRFQGVDINMGATNVEDAIVVGTTSTVVMQGINLFNVQNSFHLTSNSASLLVTSGLSDPTVNDIKVDAALTGDSAVTRLNCFMNGAFDIPTTWIPSDHAWTFFTTADNAAGATQQLWGGDQIIGHPEYGGGFSAGEGTGYSTNNAVFTTDGTTDAPGNDGTGFVDVSVEAASKEDSTFSFQDVGAGHSILWCTKRKDSSAATLKHWGVEIDQTTAAVTGSGGFIFERQTAANTWVEIGSMAVSTDEVYRYANNVFLRANSEEKIFVGISDGDTWPETLINGVTGHWLRARIGTAITTAPVFERMRLIPSHTSTNNRGQRMATGLAMWQKTLTKFPSMGGGMLPDTTYTVGSGGNISFLIKDNVLDSAANDGSVAGTLLELPTGICTAFPLQIKLIYTFKTVSTATSFNFKHYVAQVQGNLIADPAGGAIPIVRPLDDTDVWTTNAVVTDAHSTPAGVADKILSITKTTPADLADFYAGDFIFIEVDITTMNSQISIVGLEIEGVAFYDGPPQ